MDRLAAFTTGASRRSFGVIASQNILVVSVSLAAYGLLHLSLILSALIGLTAGLGLSLLAAQLITAVYIPPLKMLWQAIMHLSPHDQGTPAPDTDKLKVGRELISGLAAEIYQLVDVAQKTAQSQVVAQADLSHNFIAQSLPLPLFVLDAEETITFANDIAAGYVGIPAEDMIGKNMYMVLDMSFPSNDTFDSWLKAVKNQKAVASSSWERVRLGVRDNHPARLFDLAAYYNRGNPQMSETMLVLFDHTKQYSQDEQAVSFIALSVHELRTPLTILRGYIEVFEEEFSGKVDPEMQGFLLKMRSQAEQLSAFVNNILNVARVDNDQLELHLQEGNWSDILKSAVEMMGLRAKVRGITLKGSIGANLPPVGVDRLSIQEVINNLIDNAIKYSGEGRVIEINTSLNKAGLVETSVKDYGLGISPNIMPNLFTKFYRDHRNRAQIGGTGLGLYLSKAIIEAHGGTMWVQSKEGEGSTFGFTLLPYSQVSDAVKQGGNQEITRAAHGWIKNHSIYRQ